MESVCPQAPNCGGVPKAQDLIPEAKSARERACRVWHGPPAPFSPGSGLPSPSPSPVPSPAARLGRWKPVGPRCGVVLGARFSRAGECSAGGLSACRTMAVSERESSSARVLFVFWRGWSRGWAATEGEEPRARGRGVGAAGTGLRLSAERISPQSEPGLWIPGQPPHQIICAAPLRRRPLQLRVRSLPRRFDLGPSPSAGLPPSAARPQPRFPPPARPARGGCAEEERPAGPGDQTPSRN